MKPARIEPEDLEICPQQPVIRADGYVAKRNDIVTLMERNGQKIRVEVREDGGSAGFEFSGRELDEVDAPTKRSCLFGLVHVWHIEEHA